MVYRLKMSPAAIVVTNFQSMIHGCQELCKEILIFWVDPTDLYTDCQRRNMLWRRRLKMQVICLISLRTLLTYRFSLGCIIVAIHSKGRSLLQSNQSIHTYRQQITKIDSLITSTRIPSYLHSEHLHNVSDNSYSATASNKIPR